MASTHSRNSIRRAVAVLVVLLIGIGGSGYTHVNDKNGRKLKTEGAQVYANDDQSSGVVYTLEPGDEYQLLDVDEQWCRIRVEKDDVEGYALVIELDLDVDEILAALNETEDEAETVEAVIETTAEPTVEPTEEPTAEPTEEPIEEATEAPAGDATQAPEDTATEEPTEDATEQPTAEPTADATEAPAEPDEGDEIEREYDATHTPAPEKRVGAVDADELNVYAQADESSDVVITLERDDEVAILGEEGAFLLVSADDWQGYALAECIYELSHDEQAALKTMWGTAVVTASSLNVRKTGSTSASLLYKIKSGQRVMLRGVDGDWYCIETESGKGYVLGDHLTVNAITDTSYKQGAKGDDVKELQRRLIELKYLTGTADGSFGASTKTAVKAFQKDAGLTADGVVGTGTLNKLFALGEIKFDEEYTTLSYGDSGDAVLKLQRRLRELGYMTANATGMFGTATKSALVDFQKAAGLTADGVAGNATQVALYAANAPAKGANTISGTLKVGDKGTAVTELQKRLIELGYLTTSATGTYGEATKAAVKEFQQLAGLTADGVAGTATINALFATDAPTKVDTTTLKYGDKGDSVKALQKRLIELGYLTETANGTFGPATKAAVAEFQKAAGITADGVAGSATITALFSASAPRKADGTLKRGDRGDAVVTLQKRLRELGYLTDTADGIFGDTTEEAIKKFQKAVGLAADGVAGATTQAKLNASNAPENTAVILRQGSSGAAVKSLQKRLIELGYLGGSADGNFGTGTKSALMDFQSAAGLKVTGVADVDTQEALEASDAPEKGGVTLKQGMSGDAVKRLQNRLIELGYMTGTADGNFGASTKTAVAAFQRKAGLDADGIAGPTTLAVLYDNDAPSATPADDTLEQGDSGDAVKALQKRLIELGYMSGTADGDFGSATKAAVKLFQKQAGLTVDGVAGPGTQSALFSSNAPKYDGKTSVDTDTSSTAAKIIATAKQYMGCTYVYGTSGPNTFDCSGFTCFVFKKYGYSLLRSAQQQGYDDNYERLTRSELKMGDIVCFNTISDNDLSDHVGIYISDGNFIHASSGGGCVMISNLDSGYYNRVFSWGRRILD
jgi:peptidoglycan hydrolase-like protein with peptidoglycan-binding domain/SH3-like domain-containing protein